MDILGFKAKQRVKELEAEIITQGRAFAAAEINRFTDGHVAIAIQANEDIRMNGDRLRTKSRELSKNNTDYRRYLWMCERNIVGPNGFNLQMAIKDKDGKKNKTVCNYIEKEYKEFCKFGRCTANGKYSMRGFDKLIIRSQRIDGEVFKRRIKGFPNKFNIAYQLLDPAACPLEMNGIANNGNRIRMGIEIDKWDRPVAYYFKAASGNTLSPYLAYDPVIIESPNQDYLRIPAEEINHFFVSEFPNQMRGFPLGQAAIQEMQLLSSYFFVELVAADAASRKLGKIINKSNANVKYGGRSDSGKPEQPKKQYVTTEAGSMDLLDGDWDIIHYDPQHPAGNFPPFTKAQKRNIANGLDVAYNTFANDLEGVNFSSIRSGVLDERDNWMDSQETYIESVKEPEFGHWLEMQLFRPDFYFKPVMYDYLNQPVFLPKRWPWVDPIKDAQSSILQMAFGGTTPQDAAANLGNDFDENVEDIKGAVGKLAPIKDLLQAVLTLQSAFSPPVKGAKSGENPPEPEE